MITTGTVLVVGGTSDIGRATALRYAQAGWAVQLAARNLLEAQRNADDIAIRTGAKVSVHYLDVLETQRFDEFTDSLSPAPDTVICLIGDLGDQYRAQSDPEYATNVLRTNFEGPALLLDIFAERFEARGSGSIIGVSSVAGDRGRASNYIYGSAKAGLSASLSGLRNRLAKAGIHVMTVKPGFVETKMTVGLKLPTLLTAKPDQVARAILSGQASHRNTVYVKPIWLVIMLIINLLPESIFKRLSI
jgi:decaprenylphospho-beta-D-erythro-pentofuranosid-2-ulose 2-reductase